MRVFEGSFCLASIGRVPFYRFFFGGRVPILKKDYRKKGTLILTALLEDPGE